MWTKEDFTLKRLGIALACTAVVWLIYMAGRDLYSGEWRTYPAKVIGKQFVPDRSHWETRLIGRSDSHGHTSYHSELHYVSIPPEYHVFCVESDGTAHDFNNASTFGRVESGMTVILQARVGGLTGWRWGLHIKS